jgi:hypothetical protein
MIALGAFGLEQSIKLRFIVEMDFRAKNKRTD